MITKNDLTKHTCNEELVTAYIDNRMNENEKKEYQKKIDDCILVRKCSHCKQLILDFLTLKKNCFRLQSGYEMPKNLENKLINKIHISFQQRNNK